MFVNIKEGPILVYTVKLVKRTHLPYLYVKIKVVKHKVSDDGLPKDSIIDLWRF